MKENEFTALGIISSNDLISHFSIEIKIIILRKINYTYITQLIKYRIDSLTTELFSFQIQYKTAHFKQFIYTT